MTDTDIRNPHEFMTPATRAEQMWRVHPSDLDRLQVSRQDFYQAHIDAAIDYAVAEITATDEQRMDRVAAANALSEASGHSVDDAMLIVAALENADIQFTKTQELNQLRFKVIKMQAALDAIAAAYLGLEEIK